MIKVHYLPVFAAGTLYLGVVLTYTISVSLGHVYYLFPFISDTGAEAPESGIFGYALNVTSVFLIFSMYVRYKQVICAQEKLSQKFPARWNCLGLNFGVLACAGLNMVANFQESNMAKVHLTGAFICFTSAIIYFLIQTKISFHFVNQPYGISKAIFFIRLVTSVSMVPVYLIVMWFGKLACDEFTGEKIYYWRPEDGGFTYRLIATFGEWFVALGLITYTLTFMEEFRQVQCDNIVIRLKTD